MDPIQVLHLFIDGNYLFFSARTAGLAQNFSKLEESLLEKFGGTGKAVIGSKFFYTRPPAETDPKALLSWLKNHGYQCMTFNYTTTHQDTIYVNMVHDLWLTYFKAVMEKVEPDARFIIISGSGTLVHPISGFPKAVILACVPDSTSKRLTTVPNVIVVDLLSLIV